MAVLGFLAAALPFISRLVVENVCGLAVPDRRVRRARALFTTGFVWTLLSAVLAILIGAFLVWQPLLASSH